MLRKRKGLESNIRKMRVYMFTERRTYITLLGIYFLTFPDNTVKQIGLYTSLGSLVGFIMEIPSGYLSDIFGYKKTLILAKVSMLIATSCFLLGHSVFFFALGSIFISIGFSFTSGTMSAFFHENLQEMKQGKLFTKVRGRIQGSVSLFNALLIISIPFLTKISFELPFYVGIGIDIVGLVISLLLIEPKKEKLLEKPKNIIKILKEIKGTNLRPIIFFLAIMYGISSSTNAFRGPYLESLGYPIAYIGFVVGISRVVWFLVSRVVHKIEEIFSIKKLLFIEIFLFSSIFFLIALLKNPYIVGGLISLIVGYYRGRDSLIQNFIINLLPDKKYKATILSVKKQLSDLLYLFLVFIMGYLMNISYHLGFFTLAVLLLLGLSISYIFVKKIDNF